MRRCQYLIYLCLTNCIIRRTAIIILCINKQTKVLDLCKIFFVCADVFIYLKLLNCCRKQANLIREVYLRKLGEKMRTQGKVTDK